MTDLEFKKELEKIVGVSTHLRPFVCDGYPLKSEVFIVGINPATQMTSNFWDFWEDGKFIKSKWMEQYLLEREKKHHKISPTRRKIDYLVNEIFTDYKCLETNAYSTPTVNLNALETEQRNTDILSFLIHNIRPKAIFVHGTDPAEFIKKELGLKFISPKPVVVNYESSNVVSTFVYEWAFGKTAVCATRHLRLIKKEEITKAGKDLLTALKKV